jgi:ATP-dependent Clp protease ATP-binding subunit ClpA
MFERFTDRARRTLVLAQQEARDLSHDHIGPEHMLLGLFQAGGVAAAALSQVGADLDATRKRVAEGISSNRIAVDADKLPFSPRGKQTLELSLREALRLKHKYIGTEHILLGILRVAEKNPGAVRSALSVDPDLLRNRVIELLDGSQSRGKLRSRAIDDAWDRAYALAGTTELTTGHLVSAVLADPRSQGAKALASLGVSVETFGAALAQVPVDATSDGRFRTMEIKLGDRTTTIDDPDLIEALASMPADQLRTTFDRLKEVIKKSGGPEVAA